MTSDNNKAITSITYNHLNLPTEIYWGADKNIKYIYNASGQKIQKSVREGSEVKVVDYLDGFQYAGGVMQFFSHAEGYVKATPMSPNPVSNNEYSYNYVYNYTDHLGNVRLSYAKDPATGELKILEENHYYPFGLKHTVYNSGKMDYKTDPGGGDMTLITQVYKTDYQYKYNGKEFQDELGLGLYDYGARNYDPALGRWMNMDPLADVFFEESPYTYVSNNPINKIDPTGMFAEDANNVGYASVGVKKNGNGDYEIVSAKNDGDYGIYEVDANGNYDIKKSKRVGTLTNSFDFLFTNDSNGKFGGVAKNTNGSNIVLCASFNLSDILYKYKYDYNMDNYLLDLVTLALLSKTGGDLDLKRSLGLSMYQPVMIGDKFTSLRAASNILFGYNLRLIYERYKNDPEFKEKFKTADSFYRGAMQIVGGYNQSQNSGNGYNKGFPFYGEHTYSGVNIYRGFFHQFTNEKLKKGK